jgi:hypothetical protein
MWGLGREIGRGTWVGEFFSYYGLPKWGGLEGNREGNLGCGIFFLFWSTYVLAWKGNRERNWGWGIFVLFWSTCTLWKERERGIWVGENFFLFWYICACMSYMYIVRSRCQKVHSTWLLHDLWSWFFLHVTTFPN